VIVDHKITPSPHKRRVNFWMQGTLLRVLVAAAFFTSETIYAMSVPGGMRCIVTGGSSGIGAAVCSELGRRGARVFITGRQEETMQKVKKEVEKEGGSAAYGVGDVRSETDVKRLFMYRRASSPPLKYALPFFPFLAFPPLAPPSLVSSTAAYPL